MEVQIAIGIPEFCMRKQYSLAYLFVADLVLREVKHTQQKFCMSAQGCFSTCKDNYSDLGITKFVIDKLCCYCHCFQLNIHIYIRHFNLQDISFQIKFRKYFVHLFLIQKIEFAARRMIDKLNFTYSQFLDQLPKQYLPSLSQWPSPLLHG